MGKIDKKIRRKQVHKKRMKLLRSFHKMTPDQQKSRLNGTAAMFDYLAAYVENGVGKGVAQVTPESLMDEIDSLSKEVVEDEEDRKAGTD